MTDARLPERWLNDRRLRRLSDRDFRSYIVALVWAVSNRTDGVVEADDLDLIPGFTDDSIPALMAMGLWEYDLADRWVITDFASTQTSASQLDGLKKAA